jgi:hypothetical protein
MWTRPARQSIAGGGRGLLVVHVGSETYKIDLGSLCELLFRILAC